jgi:hypothetical protein
MPGFCFALWFGEAQTLEGDAGDVGGILLGCVGVQVVEAAFVAAADHVEDGPGERVEGLKLDFAGCDSLLEKGDESVVAGTEGFVGLAAVFLLAAHGDDEPVQVLLVGPELEACGDDDGQLLAQAVGGGYAFGDEGVELVDGLPECGGVNVFLGAEVEVERALGDFGRGSYIVHRGIRETLLTKDFNGGHEDLAPAQVGEGLLAGWGGGHGFHASTEAGICADPGERLSRKGREGSEGLRRGFGGGKS